MTVPAFYGSRELQMSLRCYADIAIDGAIWLAGEVLAQRPRPGEPFIPDIAFIYRPRHRDSVIVELGRVYEELRHRLFIAGFLKLPDNGAQRTFRRLLITHTEMLHEAFRLEWELRRAG
jgi:glycosyltransferase involved in cell wall biosynthesis